MCLYPLRVESAAIGALRPLSLHTPPLTTHGLHIHMVVTTEDAADDSDELLEQHYATLLASGTHTAEDIKWLKARRRHQEELEVCRFMLKSHTYDAYATRELVHLCYANALAGLQRRPEAIAFLQAACEQRPEEATWALTLAKMLFVENRKEESLARCTQVIDAFARGGASEEDASDAYHLAGWVKIHADDHTAAYRLWAQGHAALPDDEVLRRQTRKRLCWDGQQEDDDLGLLGEAALRELVGERHWHFQSTLRPA